MSTKKEIISTQREIPGEKKNKKDKEKRRKKKEKEKKEKRERGGE